MMNLLTTYFSSFQSLTCVRLFMTPWTAAHQASLSFISWSLLKLRSIESVMPSNHLILCHPLLLQPPIFPSIRVFSNEPLLHIRWTKYWSFSFSMNPSNEYLGLISFRMDWLDLLAVQGTLKSLLQHHNSKATILWCSAFFILPEEFPVAPRSPQLVFPVLSSKASTWWWGYCPNQAKNWTKRTLKSNTRWKLTAEESKQLVANLWMRCSCSSRQLS